MPGRHLAPGRGRFLWELTRYIVAWAAIVGALVGVFWLISNLLPTWLGTSATSTSTSVVAVETTLADTTSTTTSTTTTTIIDTTTTTTSSVPAVREPGTLWVLVLNSTGSAGLAGTASGVLDEAGYLMLTPDNYSTQLEKTRILHAKGLGIEAARLANEFFPEAEVLLDSEGLTAADPDIVVILGADYDQ